MSKDISRFLFQPRKRYASVRMQQGRVILDSDWNESERIDDEEARRTLVDVICSRGTSNRGFRTGNVRGADVEISGGDPVDSYDFDFENGSFYIGGLRFESESDGGPETFLTQADWLQIDALPADLPVRPADLPPAGTRNDLVYLMGWEQCVTAVEDSELREQALGGPDTSVRIRRMRRVAVLPDVPDSCAAAFAALQQKITAPVQPDTGLPHRFDADDCELKSKARLTVAPNPGGITEDPCKPAVPGGYLGAENQTIRVQLTATNRFIWGYDNSAPLYRVQVENIPDAPQGVDGTRRKIRFLTLPRDQAAQPLAGQAVEIIPWGAILPNREKVAEFQGQFFTVETSFDPEDGSLTVTEPVPEAWLEWLAEHPQFWSSRDDAEHRQYLYLRLWTGGSGDASDPDFPFTPGTPADLEGTGLSVTFSDHGLPGDFWVIAARPGTPDLVVPWELLEGAPPAGPRYFFAPLALIRWSLDPNNTPRAAVHDCRERFRPMCDVRGCCTVTVGDGVSSHGDFESIEEAIDFLPDAGGEVCLLPGQHRTNATLAGRRRITIKGCGSQTRVVPRESNLTGPIFRVVDSQNITLREMELVTLNGAAIVLEGTQLGVLKEVLVTHNRVLAFAQAVQVRRGVDIHIHENHIRMLDKEGAGVAIQILAEDSVIERNDIGVVPARDTTPPDEPGDNPDPTDECTDAVILFARPAFLTSVINHVFGVVLARFPPEPFKALGGIQVVAGSERIRILDNMVKGGAGDGILLGGSFPVIIEAQPGNPPVTIESTGDRIQGTVLLNDSGISGISLAFTRVEGVTRTAVSGSGGFFSVRTEPGQYTVSVPSGFEIEKVGFADDVEFGRFHEIRLVRQEQPKPEDLLAFLYEIHIEGNEIVHMGLCGIGHPIVPLPSTPAPTLTTNPAAAAILDLLGNPVVTLEIRRNHIHDCLQNPFEGELRAESRRRGLGGVSLGFCENIAIGDNRIERNGTTHVNPACGIFIRFGEKIDIHHNNIIENGPFDAASRLGLEPGVRGGIALLAASFGFEDLIQPPGRVFDTGRHAARIHDNIVHQPAGHALRLFAAGPASVCDNRFETDLAGLESFERLAGAVAILALGGASRFPTGVTLFSSNQSWLGPGAASFSSQLIWTTDDLGFHGNHSVALTDGIVLSDAVSLFTNTYLLGRTVRAGDSRFIEPPGSRRQSLKISLLSRTTLLNNTNDNHGDHCIFAFNTAPGRPPIIAGNQVVDSTLCPRLNSGIAAPATEFRVRPVTAGD